MRHLQLSLLSLLLLVSCAPDPSMTDPEDLPESLRPGSSITVMFRRDHLGAAASLPIPPTSQSHNGAATALFGTLVGISKEWVIVEQKKVRYWIARESVLMLCEK